MWRICGTAVLTLLLPAIADAQPRRCAPRAAVGAAVGLQILDTEVDPALAGVGRHGLATTTGTGLEGSVHAIVPFAAEWGVTAEAASGSMAVALERDASGTYINERTGDDVAFRRVVGGVLKTRAGYRSCTYFGIKVGLYRYSYRGVSSNAGGGAAMMGSDIPLSESGALFFELEIGVGVTKARSPLTPSPVVPTVQSTFGFRYRF